MTDQNEQAVIVFLNGTDLPDEIYEQFDIADLEDRLIAAIDAAGTGEYDGNEFGPNEVVLFMYGPDADRLYESVSPILSEYPLCRGARIVVRYGGPKASAREILLPLV